MKSLNTLELDHLIENLSDLLGADFQAVQGGEGVLALKFWNDGVRYLLFHLKQNKPFFLFLKDRSQVPDLFLQKANKKPIHIFLLSHFKGESLTKVTRLKKFGRVVRFYFGKDESLYLEFKAFPGGLNLSAYKGNKVVHWSKPLALEPLQEKSTPSEMRTCTVIEEEALEFLNKTSSKTKQKKHRGKDKVQTATAKLLEAIAFLEQDSYKNFADSLRAGEKLPSSLQTLYRENLSLEENIEWAYEQQKLKALKLERLNERLKELKTSGLGDGALQQSSLQKAKSSVPSLGRKLELSKGVWAYCGRTAKENMGLLRRAKSWHLWMHLKDYPSGHLILDCSKPHKVSEEELRKAALFLFKVAAPKKLHSGNRVKFEVIFTESKFVKPIKGAKEGLVQPQRTQSRLYEWTKEHATYIK